MLAEENIEEYVEVPEAVGGESGEYVLRIKGESMKDAGILPDDFVVVRPQDTATDGDIVVALVGEEATVKTVLPRVGPHPPAARERRLEPIRSNEVRVLGRVVGLLRRM